MIFIWFLFIYFEAARNFAIIINGSRPNYLQSFIIRAMAAILHGVLLDVKDWQEYLTVLIFQVSSFYACFDFILNWMRGKEMFYLGTGSLIDRILRDRPVVHLIVKLISFVLMIWFLIKLL